MTPSQKGAASVQTVEPFQVAPDGQTILHTATAPYVGAPSASSPVYVPYAAHRQADGWENRSLAQPMDLTWGTGTLQYLHGIVGTSANLRYALVSSTLALAPGAVPGGGNLYRLNVRTGALTFIAGAEDALYPRGEFFQVYPSAQAGVNSKYVANDGNSIVFLGRAALFPGGVAGVPDDAFTFVLYRWTADAGLEVISKLPAAEGGAAVPVNSAGNDRQDALSTRNSIPRTQGGTPRFAFTSNIANAGSGPAYLWEDGETRAISITRFSDSPPVTIDAAVRAVSDDGRFILLATRPGLGNRLTDDTPVNFDANLYRYDADQDSLDFVGVLGQNADIDYDVLQMTHGGRSVAFTSTVGQLPGAEAGRRNLYVWRDGALKLVAVPDVSSPASTGLGIDVLLSEDGRYLAFSEESSSLAQQFGFDNISTGCAANGQPVGPCQQVYRFDADAATDALKCLSCRSDGQTPRGASGDPVNRTLAAPGVSGSVVGATMPYNSHVRQIVADDGTVFFTSADDLIPGDGNGEHDAYAWQDGQLRLLSRARPGMRSRFVDASPDGKTVLVATNDPITTDDTDRAVDLYVTREGAGVARAPKDPEPECSGGDCRGQAPRGDAAPDASTQHEVDKPAPRPTGRRAKVSLSSLRLRGRTLRAAVRVNDAGRLRISGPGLRSTAREVRSAGLYRLTVRLTSKNQRKLARNHRLALRARVSLSPPFGRSTAKTYRRTVRS